MINQDNDSPATLTAIKIQEDDGSISQLKDGQIEKVLLHANDKVDQPLDSQLIKNIVDQVMTKIPLSDNSVATRQDLNTAILRSLKEQGNPQLAQVANNQLLSAEINSSKATDINFTIQKLLNKDKTVVNENANKDSHVFNTQRDLTAGTVARSIGLKMLPPRVAKAHMSGDIHWHDLDYQPYSPMTNCCLIDFKEMLTNGFKIGN
ncbi:anaerobic ribonucleoside-triphosphate reductase, partial [Oenococcus oeni]